MNPKQPYSLLSDVEPTDDNSEDYAPAKLLFRTVTGKVHKIYEQVNPWALPILQCVTN